MGVHCTTAILVVGTLASISYGLEESLQSLELVGAEKSPSGNKTQLQEFRDHAENKRQSFGGEDTTEHDSTTEHQGLLPTPVTMKTRDPDAEVVALEKKPSVPKKGVIYKKPSVVPKKEVHFTPSVVAKKGADPESSTPSVSPRKGVELSQGNPIISGSPLHDFFVSSEITNDTDVSILSIAAIGSRKDMNAPMKSNGIENEKGNGKGNPSNITTPQLVHTEGKSGDTLLTVDWNPPQPSRSSKVSNSGHFKPTTADDPSSSSNQVNYVPIFMIIALLVLVVVVVAVGYHRLKDIWARRHYNYVDFLIDGMYE